jgi:hypothetical protein
VGGIILAWDDSTNPAVVFNVYVSDDPFRTGGGSCLAAGLAEPILVESGSPPPGSIRYYLVTGMAAVEGSAGLRSDGTPRPVGGGCGGR